jgi:esterase/lipase superfamily enzyme
MTALLRYSVPVFVAWSLACVVGAADEPQRIWLVSTREATRCCDSDCATSGVRCWRLNEDCGWSSAAPGDFRDGAAIPTVVFVHGNRTDADDAVAMGMHVYQAIRSETCGRPFRYVIWSWPADRVYRRVRPDAQLKAAYGDAEGCYLADWLANLQSDVKVSLIGYSFGPRVICGALQILSGGDVSGRKLGQDAHRTWNARKRKPIRAVLLATADDFDSLGPDGRHGQALSLLDKALITRNGCDHALRFYDRLYGRGGPDATGLVGPSGIDNMEKVSIVDVSGSVGKSHDYRCYCSAICGQWARYTFLDE